MADKLSVAQAVLDAFDAREVDRLPSLFTPDVEFRTRVDVIGDAEFRGHDGVRAWLAAVDEKYDLFEVADVEYRPGEGDAVVVSARLRLCHAGDRYGMSRMVYWVFRVGSDGRVAAFTSYRDLTDALAAAGVNAGGA